jgi:hypothetical protein
VSKLQASDYELIFESNKVGAAILDDLIQRFSRELKSSGIDRILDSERMRGRREVLDFIVMRINQANGVQDDEPTEE